MKLLLGLLVGLIILAALVVSYSAIDRQNQEKAAFEQLSAAYLQIPNYPDAQNIWRGSRQEKLADQGWVARVAAVLIGSFTTPDSKSLVMGFYKSTLESNGWRYEDDGHGGHVSLTCSSYLEGDFYVNSQNEYVWVAEYYPNREYRIYKVRGWFWGYSDCF